MGGGGWGHLPPVTGILTLPPKKNIPCDHPTSCTVPLPHRQYSKFATPHELIPNIYAIQCNLGYPHPDFPEPRLSGFKKSKIIEGQRSIATCSIARGYYNNYTIALQLSGLIQLSGTLLKIFGQRGPDNGGCTVHVYIIMYRTNIYICITLSVRTSHTYLLPYQYVSHCQNVLAIPTYYRTNIYICITLSVRTSHTYLLALASCTGNSPLEQRARKELDCMTQIRQSDGKST